MSKASDSSTVTLLDKLSQDVFIAIFSLCDMDSLMACRQVCRQFSILIKTDLRLRYKMELSINGMVDGPPGGLSIGERLERLREYRAHFHSSFRCGALVPHRARFQWGDLQVSLLASSPCSYVVKNNSETTATVYSAPHLHGKPKMHEIVLPENCIHDIRDEEVVAVDVAQDLVVVSRKSPGTSDVYILFLSLETGQPHAAAALPIVHLPDLGCYGERVCISRTQIYGRYIAWHIAANFGTGPLSDYSDVAHRVAVHIWNWETGELIWKHECTRAAPFTFLDMSRVVLVQRNSLKVYQFAAAASDGNHHDVIETLPEYGRTSELELELPQSKWSVAYDIGRPAHYTPCQGDPFSPDPSHRVITVHFVISMAARPDYTQHTLLIPLTTFRRHMPLELSASAPPKDDRTRSVRVPWNEWGPRGCLYLRFPHVVGSMWGSFGYYNRAIAIHTYGSRAAVVLSQKTNPRLVQVVIYDFNPWAALSDKGDTITISDGSRAWRRLLNFGKATAQPTVPHTVYAGPYISVPGEDEGTAVVVLHGNGFTLMNEGYGGCSFQTYCW